jgi:C4-dicarboxylate transporter DctM subunit
MSPFIVGIIGIIVLVLVLLSGIPVAFGMILVGFVGVSYLLTWEAGLFIIGTVLWDTFTSYTLLVIPLFVLMGQIAFHSGISGRIYNTAYKWLGHQPGGVAMATIGGCAGFAAICGSSPATAATMGTVALPEMRKYHYDLALATGTVAAGGTLGILIPPSVVLIIYGIMAEESIGKLFVAGILPGILLTLLFLIILYIKCRRNPHLGPAGPKTTFKEKLASLPGTIEMLLLFGLVIGGLLVGWFTPTEAGGAGSAGALLIALARKGLPWSAFKTAIMDTMRMACMILFIIGGAIVFGRFLTLSRIPLELANWVTSLPAPPLTILLIIFFVYFLGGCFMDALSFLIITIPIFLPVVKSLGYDPIWFGVVMVVLLETGAVTPPVGMNVYVIKGIATDVPLETIFKGILPFVLMMVVCIAILIIFPQIALFLPGLR